MGYPVFISLYSFVRHLICRGEHGAQTLLFLAYSTVTVSFADMHRRFIRTIIYLSL